MENLRIKASDGSGEFSAYVATPDTDQTAPAVLVIQEIFGVNHVMRDICDNLAQNGYMAVCPDLFWRQEEGVDITDQTEKEWDKAFALFNGFNVDKGIDDCIATLDTIRKMETSTSLVGSLGFCLGGKLAYLMATRSDIDCSVSYYGVGIEGLLDEVENIDLPLLMHIAAEDKFSSPEAQNKITAAIKDQDYITHHIYDGCDHAFARVGGEHYNENATRIANLRTSDFLATYLSRDAL